MFPKHLGWLWFSIVRLCNKTGLRKRLNLGRYIWVNLNKRKTETWEIRPLLNALSSVTYTENFQFPNTHIEKLRI